MALNSLLPHMESIHSDSVFLISYSLTHFKQDRLRCQDLVFTKFIQTICS